MFSYTPFIRPKPQTPQKNLLGKHIDIYFLFLEEK